MSSVILEKESWRKAHSEGRGEILFYYMNKF